MTRVRRITKWGLPAVLIIIGGVFVVVKIGQSRFDQMTQREIATLFDASQPVDGVFSAENITHLPEPVQRYLIRSIPEGYPLISSVMLQQEGKMRQSPEQTWSPFEAYQVFTINPPAFVWMADMHMMPLLDVAARDKYQDGHGEMLIALQATIPIANGQGKTYDTGAFIRYMAEMMWFPTAMLQDYITWEAIDDRTAIAVATVADQSVRVTFHFDDNSDIAYIESHDRHMGDDVDTTAWYGYCHDYQRFDGVRIPTSIEVGWAPDSGYYAWWRGTITQIEYDPISIN